MKKRTGALLLLSLMCSGTASPARGQAQQAAIDSAHWSFTSIADLARDGFVLGYRDATFLGGRALTRYEMASLVKRVVDNIACSSAGGPRAWTHVRLAQAVNLIEEFKVELAVIGADLATARGALPQLERVARSEQGSLSDTSGANSRSRPAEVARPPDGPTVLQEIRRRVQFSGFMQPRFVTRFGDGNPILDNQFEDSDARGLSGNRRTFKLRQARVGVQGNLNDSTAYRLELDAGSQAPGSLGSVAIRQGYGVINPFLTNRSVAEEQRTSLQGSSLRFGLQPTPFGFHLQRSTTDREVTERYIGFSGDGAGLFRRQDYELGVSYAGEIAKRVDFQVGVFNSQGENFRDRSRRKSIVGRVGVAPFVGANVGASIVDGAGPTRDFVDGVEDVDDGELTVRRRSLFGVDAQYSTLFGVSVEFEYLRGQGGQDGNRSLPDVYNADALRPYVDAAFVAAWYAQVSFDVTKRLSVVTAYDFYNRNARPAVDGPLSTIEVDNELRRVASSDFVEQRQHSGILFSIDQYTRLRFWLEVPLNYPNLPGRPDPIHRTPVFTSELQVKF